MSPDSEPTLPPVRDTNPVPEYLSEVWLDLDWSPWVPFDAPREFFYIPKEPGVYRIRPAGEDFLMYIGETGQSLHKKLAEFRQALRRADLMPWSDPHEAAPCLWAYWVEWAIGRSRETPKDPIPGSDGETDDPKPVMFEFSAAPLDASPAGRKGMAAFLLYRYRQDHGESPVCNFGRFHPRYRRSSTRREGRRGAKLEDGQKDNPAGFLSIPPLPVKGTCGSSDWMGLEWSTKTALTPENVHDVAHGAGLYLITDAVSQEILDIGQSADIRKRLLDQCKKDQEGRELEFSYQVVGESVFSHNLKELECDLIGNFFEQNRMAPELRYRNTR